ncbi:PAS domain S-box protein [Bacillus sp. HMF5848]|uniref:PAS domain S-box protein n=1 Tax=Bacillus sp. HMF5848 TaxID=2495421 RepID=UPI000F7A026A|nr:PAS domain S-box protein [Bacillus sp. HMF5848]RSK28153.1 PAS domain S-box protein [Bacillus sp. HMF5848]
MINKIVLENKLILDAFNNSTIGQALVSKDGQLLRVNPFLCDLFGYTEDELLNKRFQDITYHEDLDTDLKLFQDLLNGGTKSYMLEKRYIQKSGKVIWGSLNVMLVQDDKGDPLCFLSLISDITQKKYEEEVAKRKEAEFYKLIESAPEPLVIVIDQKLFYINQTALNALNCSKESILNTSIYDMIIPSQIDLVKERQVLLHEKEQYLESIELTLNINGRLIDVETSPTSIIYNDKLSIQVILKDISARKAIERENERDIALAKILQQRLIGNPITELDISIDGIYKPSKDLGGDLFTWYRIDRDRIGVIMIDIMDHGLPSALVSFSIHSLLSDIITKEIAPSNVMQSLQKHMKRLFSSNYNEDNLTPSYFSAIYLVIDTHKNVIDYINAGHPAGIVICNNSSILLESDFPPIGMIENIEFTHKSIKIEHDAKIILYTDGLLDLMKGSMAIGIREIENYAIDWNTMDEFKHKIESFLNSQPEHFTDDISAVYILINMR